MKKLIAAIFALVLFFLILNFGPNGNFRREEALNDAVKSAMTGGGQPIASTSEVTAPEPAATPTPEPAPTATASIPHIDTGNEPVVAETPSAPAPAVATSSEPAAPASIPAPVEETPAAPMAAVPASEPAPAVVTAPEPPPAPTPSTPAPAPAPVVEPAPVVAEVKPAPAPTPAAPVVPPAPAPAAPAPVVVAETPAPAPAPAVVETPAAPRPTKLPNPKVVILGYYRFNEPGAPASGSINRISVEAFEKQMAWLRDHSFQVISLSELTKRLRSGEPLPEHAAVITINNGFSNAVSVAAPILRKYGYPWSLLVYTDFIEQSPKAVTWTDLITLSKTGVEIGSQSKTHPYLAELDGKPADQYDKWLSGELTGSKQKLERKIQKPVTVLALPYGNTNEVVEKKAAAAGYDVLLDTTGNPVVAGDSPLHLGRLIINQFTAPYFETILSEPDIRLTRLSPASGAVVRTPQPTVSATLSYGGKIDPKSVRAELSTGGQFKPNFDAATQTLSFAVNKNLLEGPVFVVIKAKDLKTGKPLVAFWQFHYLKAN